MVSRGGPHVGDYIISNTATTSITTTTTTTVFPSAPRSPIRCSYLRDTMNGFEHYKQLLSDAHYVEEALTVLDPLARSPQTRDLARSLYTELIGSNMEALRGSPSEWFNFATTAARIDHTSAQRRILEVALAAHPNDVDLLCEWFQFQFAHGSIADAIEAWQPIESLGEELTAPYWRYWAYRSLFLARYLNDKAQAVEFLDRAQQYVTPADLLNIFRHYRAILLDGAVKPAPSAGKLTKYETLVALVEAKYREGLELGIENGYVLATDLALLLRERSAGKSKEEADQILDQALTLLDEAERAYTNSQNHPIARIYVEKAITLMARRRYADALQIFRSLPVYSLDRDESMKVMRNYAANMTGQPEPVAVPTGAGEQGDLGDRLDQLENVLALVVQKTGIFGQSHENDLAG
jgi:tetratricopeptide (TPR) repeat protein